MQINQYSLFSHIQQSPIRETIQDWLITQLAERLEIDAEDIDIYEPFDNYNLDSFQTMVLLGKLEKWLGCKLNPTLIFNYPTIEKLAQRLAEQTSVS
jgi:acyl carrier protein